MMVAKESRNSPSAPLPPIGDLLISVDEEPSLPNQNPASGSGSTSKKSGSSGGWMKTARTKASGKLRRTLFGRSTKRRTKDAEDMIREEDEGNYDYSQDNYDTVKSLPASGHYGRSRVGNTSHSKLIDLANELKASRGRQGSQDGSQNDVNGSSLTNVSKPPVIIFRVPRKNNSNNSPSNNLRISPGATGVIKAPLSDPVFDFYTWHTSADDNHDAVYSLFMKAHKCYDLIPTSTKLVVFDTHLPVRKAFYALVYNGVRAAPLWCSDTQQFTGMLTITDFIKILCRHYDAGDNAERVRALENQQISHWREQFERDGSIRPFVSIDPNESLHRAVEVLCESKVHRLPVLDRKTGNITYILTHKRIMKFLSLYMRDLPRPSFMSSPPRDLGIGSWGDVLCCRVDTSLHDALEIFLKNRVSALPLVDKDGKVVDIYAKFDVISLAAENSYDKLDCTVQEALTHRSEWFEGVHTCLETDSLFTVLENIVKAEVHRLIVTDVDKKVVGVISLSDILKYLVLDPCQQPLSCADDTATTSSSTENDVGINIPSTSSTAIPVPKNSYSATATSSNSSSMVIPEAVEVEGDDFA